MLTRLQIRRFKVFSDADIELGPVTVLCGPNNSGKTAALQAIALWQLGLKAWQAERGKGSTARERVGVPINRRDLVSIPVPETNLLWHGLHVREGFRQNGHTVTRNLRIDITVSGVGPSGAWECGLEFDYSGPEVIYVRPQRLSEQPQSGRMPVPEAAGDVRVAMLPAMSGLGAVETCVISSGRKSRTSGTSSFPICGSYFASRSCRRRVWLHVVRSPWPISSRMAPVSTSPPPGAASSKFCSC